MTDCNLIGYFLWLTYIRCCTLFHDNLAICGSWVGGAAHATCNKPVSFSSCHCFFCIILSSNLNQKEDIYGLEYHFPMTLIVSTYFDDCTGINERFHVLQPIVSVLIIIRCV